MIPEWVLKLIKIWIDGNKTGYLQINFFKGGISSVNKFVTIKE